MTTLIPPFPRRPDEVPADVALLVDGERRARRGRRPGGGGRRGVRPGWQRGRGRAALVGRRAAPARADDGGRVRVTTSCSAPGSGVATSHPTARHLATSAPSAQVPSVGLPATSAGHCDRLPSLTAPLRSHSEVSERVGGPNTVIPGVSTAPRRVTHSLTSLTSAVFPQVSEVAGGASPLTCPSEYSLLHSAFTRPAGGRVTPELERKQAASECRRPRDPERRRPCC